VSVFRLDPARSAVPDPVLSDELLDFVARRYGFEADAPRDLGGSFNLNVLVDRYVVRVYGPWVSEQRLRTVQRTRRTLAAKGVPIPELVPAVDGSSLCGFGGYVLEVERFVSGERMATWEQLAVGVRTLGRLHTLMLEVDIDVPPAIANHLPQELAVSATAEAVGLIRSWGPTEQEERYAEIAEELADLLPVFELPSQPVHGDFWDNNVLFRDGAVVAVLDFDFADVRPRVDDLALSLGYLLQTGHSPTEVRDLVDAYDAASAVPLSTDERRALPFAMARMALFFLQYLLIPGDDAYERRLRREFCEQRGPACEWWLRAVRSGTVAESCFT
jgi:Ser/Thr protein kinase RdoA (MazF antagonist)